ncbi:hypothetical protein ACFSUK_25825 [Sphingobium scionense]
MSGPSNSILLVGESGVGKTHYGAQLLRRLMRVKGALRMNGAATNLEAFETALESLDEGRAAGHTARTVNVDSVWPVVDSGGRRADLIWPEYGGEQIKSVIENRRLPDAWQKRVDGADAWLLLVRLQQAIVGDDMFSKPLADLKGTSVENREVHQSDQARLVELLQMLLFSYGSAQRRSESHGSVCFSLVGTKRRPRRRLPKRSAPGYPSSRRSCDQTGASR